VNWIAVTPAAKGAGKAGWSFATIVIALTAGGLTDTGDGAGVGLGVTPGEGEVEGEGDGEGEGAGGGAVDGA
jgi:hypothetical protein